MLYDWSMDSNYSTDILGSKITVACARVGRANATLFFFSEFFVAYFAKRNLNGGGFEKRQVRNPARIPPQTPPAGGKPAEAGRIHIPSQMFRPAESALVFRIFRKMGSDFFKQTPPDFALDEAFYSFVWLARTRRRSLSAEALISSNLRRRRNGFGK